MATKKKSKEPSGDLVVLGQGAAGASPRPSSSAGKVSTRPLSRQSSGFEVLPPDESSVDSRPSSAASDGRNSAASGRRSYTPSKQVALPTVKRKEDTEDYSFGTLDWREHEELGEKQSKHLNGGDSKSLNEHMSNLSVTKKPITNGDIAQESSDDSDEESSSEEEEIKAPNELMMEFISCMMEEDYVNALKLCKMILIYEPDNAEAKEFLPVIEEKMQLDAEAEAEGEEEESGDDDDDDEEEDSDDDSDDDDDDDSDSAESSNDSDEEEDKKTETQSTTVVFNMPS